MGNYVKEYPDIAGKLARKLEANGAETTLYIGNAHYKGEGLPRNPHKAFEYYKVGIEKGDPRAANNFVICARELNQEKIALEYLKEMAEKGNLAAREILAKHDCEVCYNARHSVDSQRIKEKSIKWLKECAEADYVEAIMLIAKLYDPYCRNASCMRPLGMYESAETAYGYYQHAAELGIEDAIQKVRDYDEKSCQYCGRPGALYYPDSVFKTKRQCRYCGKKEKEQKKEKPFKY